MAVPRSHQFNPNLDPELLRSIEATAGSFKPYRAELRSGYRPGDKRFHGKGEALDIQLYDPTTGAPLDSYQRGGAAGAYQQFANAWYQSLSPEQQAKARWGGYFGDPNDPTYGQKYGDQDFMHFDFGRSDGLGMLGGDWSTGFRPEAVKALGLSGAGGIGGGGAPAGAGGGGAAPGDPHQQWLAQYWPMAQAVGKQTGIDPRVIMAQAALETGYGKSVPNNNLFGIKGGGTPPVKTLEFINGKMTPTEASFAGYKDPQAAFDAYGKFMSSDRYAGVRSGKSLEEQVAALGKSGYATDPDYGSKILSIATGIPAGGFAGGPSGPVEAAGGGAGNEAGQTTGGTGAPAAAAPEGNWLQKIASSIGKGGVDLAGKMGGQGPVNTRQPYAAAARIDQGEVPTIDPAASQRQQLAMQMALARLNSGKLYG